MAVLDLSKELMYNFFYNVLRAHYGTKISVNYTDTDSLIMNVMCPDFFESLLAIQDHFDFSNLPKDHFMYSCVNKKVPGKMKLETGAEVIHEFIGLKPKMYSLLFGSDVKEMKRAKGVKSSVLKRHLHHSSYVDCLKDRKKFINRMRRIGSKNHEIFTIEEEKVSLSPYDDKRFYDSSGLYSVPYGYKI